MSMTENKALETALEKVKAQKVNFGFLERFDVDENWEVTKALEEVQQYRAIGTVSEFRELKEKATAKKPLHQGFVYVCPCCNDKATIGSTLLRINQKYCPECGTEFDWSEGQVLIKVKE